MRMVSDEELYQADAEGVEWGAPIHAWRILGRRLTYHNAAHPYSEIIRTQREVFEFDGWAALWQGFLPGLRA